MSDEADKAFPFIEGLTPKITTALRNAFDVGRSSRDAEIKTLEEKLADAQAEAYFWSSSSEEHRHVAVPNLIARAEAAEAVIAKARKAIADEPGYTPDLEIATLDAVTEILDADPQSVLAERIAQAKAEAIKEIADHLATANVLCHGDSGVTVYESEDDFYTGSQRPQPIVDWLRARAAGEVDNGRD